MHGFLAFLFVAFLQATQIRVARCLPRSAEVEQRSLQDIYQAALKEPGTLRVAWGGDVKASGQGIKTAFENRFPGMELALDLDVSKYLDGKIDLAYASTNGSNDGFDVAVLQSLHDFPRWKSEGRLLPYKVAPWNEIYPQFVDSDGMYMGLYIFSFGSTIYNANATALSSLPANFHDYLEPQWHDRLILTYPNDDDAVLFLFDTIIQKYGFDYLHSLQAQKPRWVRGTATPSILMSPATNSSAKNPRAISFTSTSGFVQGVSEEPPQDVYMVWPQTGAIFATTQVPESAKLFLGFLMDDEWQQAVGGNRYATLKTFDKAGVFNQSGIDPLAYGRFMADRQRVETLRFKIESVIGPPQGKDPVDEY